MFGHMMRMVLGLGVIAGAVAYGWTTVFGTLNDIAIRDAGVPPKVWHAFKRYKPEGELADIRQVVAFMKEAVQGGMPPELLRGQFMEFCADDVDQHPQHNLEACRACFNLLIDEVVGWSARRVQQRAEDTVKQEAAAVRSGGVEHEPSPAELLRRERMSRRARAKAERVRTGDR